VRENIRYDDEVSEALHDSQACEAASRILRTSDLNWLLHRAAQRIGEALEAEANRFGVGMRGQLVLSALISEAGRTQLALGAALGLDKTTLTTVLDKLERDGLVRRLPHPTDRRVRIPAITEAGRELHQRVDDAVHVVEENLLRPLDPAERKNLEVALRRLVDADVPGTDRPAGSCM
jgi:MarR family transcriptional regulator, organic hydroperoxide resistance regulator